MKRRGKIAKRIMAAFTSAIMLTGVMIPTAFVQPVSAASARAVEKLTRGLTVTALSSGTLVNWRYLGTDSSGTVFKLYRDNTLIYTSSGEAATCFKDSGGSINSNYKLEVYKNGSVLSATESAEYKLNYDKTANGGYFDIQLDVPSDSRLGATYTPNDASVADLDGDGKYELIIKWDPNNSQDNSKSGNTSNVIIDAYKLEAGDASRLWRVDLGQNIRAGAHYTQFMVYDFDSDGKAEMVCKTAPGSKDGSGKYVNQASSVSAIKNASDNSKAYANSSGYILSGSEYLTLFDGESGKALDTIYYEPERGDISKWGDNYGNRVDRFLAGVAYLNGTTPSVVMCRGYYTRTVIAAYNVVNKRLSKQWLFDTDSSGNSSYAGQGNHNLVAADVDGDGNDEIVYGSMTVDHNGKGLYSTGLGHGDAVHVGDFIPNRSGLEVYQVLEETYGASLRDAKTGKSIQRWNATSDTGRGVADNIIPGNDEAEFCSSADGVIYNSSGKAVANWSEITKWGQNSLIYWDGDLEREVLDRTMIDGYGKGRIFTGQNVTYNNGSKSNMCITADIFGDWREEIVAPLSDGSGVRVYATTHSTDYRIYTPMHNTQYRCGVAAENVAYNQPPHVDYWLATGSSLPQQPNVYAVGEENTEISFKAVLTGDNIENGTYASPFTVDNKFRLVAAEDGNIVINDSVKPVGDRIVNKFINLKVKGTAEKSAIELSAKEAGDLYIGVLSGNSSAARNLSVYDSSGTRLSVLDAPVSGTESVSLQKVTMPKADKYYIYSTSGSVYVYFVGSTAQLNTYATEKPVPVTTQSTTKVTTEATTQATTQAKETTTEATTQQVQPQQGASHNFDNGTGSSFYTISGKTSTSYGDVSYNGINIKQCLKMESSTNISFNAAQAGSLTLVLNSAQAGKTIKIDGNKQTIPTDGVLTVALTAGSHTVTKGDTAYLYYMNFSSAGDSDATTKATTESTTESTTVTTKATTTITTTEATTTTTTTTTESTTEATTQQVYAITINYNNGYNFDGLNGRLTDNNSYGGAYAQVTGDAANDGENYVAFSNDGYALLNDTDTGATTVLGLPIEDRGNIITIKGSFKPVTENNNWTLMQIHGKTKDNAASEIVGIRTNAGTYNLRAMGANLIDSGVAVKKDTTVDYVAVIDKINGRVQLTIGTSTVSADISCESINEIRFVTAKASRNLYVGSVGVSSIWLGDANNSNTVNREDVAKMLRYIIGTGENIDLTLADFNGDGVVDLQDCVEIIGKL